MKKKDRSKFRYAWATCYRKSFLLLSMMLFCTMVGIAQQIEVSGNVTDSYGDPLPGVSVVLKGTAEGTVTNMEGYYMISDVPSDGVLVFTFMGKGVQEIPVNNRTVIDVSFEDEIFELDETVVVGYGVQKKSDVTGAVASFDNETLSEMPQTTVTQALQGRLAGVSIVANSSDAEGNSNSIQVRGVNSISASNSPLVVVDGIPFSGRLSEITPNDIESIEVLKDASSSAIYGARAANGVILITTKKGVEGEPVVSYNGFYGVDEIAHLPDIMNAEQFFNTKIERMGMSSMTTSEVENYADGVDTDWVDLATRLGSRQQHNLSVSGGTENTHYYLSGVYDQVKGIAKNDDFDRLTLRINLDSEITSWLTIGTNTQLGYYDRGGEPASFQGALTMNPLAVPFEEDNKTINIVPWPEDPFFENPLEGLNIINEDESRSVITNNFLKVDVPFIKGLSYRINTGYNYRYRLVESYMGANTLDGLTAGGVSQVNNWADEDWTVENIVDYNRSFGLHKVGFTGLYSVQKITNKAHDLTSSGFPSDIMTYYQARYATTWNPSDVFVEQGLISQMGRINYSFDSRYLLTLTARRDGFSAFGENSKYGVFPSVAVGWNMHNENFFDELYWINSLKLRGSYGKNGNQAISPYSTLPGMSSTYILDNEKVTAVGFYPSGLGDPTLGWETTNSLNIGIDFSFLNNRIQGSFDYFNSNTHDLLLNRRISPVNGTTSIRQNIGETKNNGFEFQVSSVNVDRGDFNWRTDFNFSKYNNEIVHVGLRDEDGNPIDDVANEWFIGESLGVNYGYVFDGIWQTDGDFASSAQPSANPGDVKVRDVNGDGLITPDDRAILGSSLPSFSAGITNTLEYKNLSLSFFVHTVQGVTKWNPFINTWFDGRENVLNHSYWTPENPTNAWPANGDDVNSTGVSVFGEPNDASFIRLKDITLGYDFGDPLLERLNLNHMRVFFNAKNVWTSTDWVGMDPEFSNQYTQPLTRTFILGIRFTI